MAQLSPRAESFIVPGIPVPVRSIAAGSLERRRPTCSNSAMDTKPNQGIPERVLTFVEELRALVRQSAMDAVQGVLSGMTATERRKPGRPAGATAGRMRATVRRVSKRVKRSSDQVDAIAARLLAHI